MRKVLVTLCIMGLLMGIASMAMAVTPADSKTDWILSLRGTDSAYGSAAGKIQVGTRTNFTDGKDATGTPAADKYYTANTGSQAQVAIYRTDWGGSPSFYAYDQRAPINTTVPWSKSTLTREWTLRFWVGTGYSTTKTTARLSWWQEVQSSGYYNVLPSNINGVPYEYYIRVDHDPTGTYADGYLRKITPGVIGTMAAPTDYLEFGNNNLAAIKMSDIAAQTDGVKLTLMAVPEPGSFLALGSGLVGLLGFAVRRRRA